MHSEYDFNVDLDTYINTYGTTDMVDLYLLNTTGYTPEQLKVKSRKRPLPLIKKMWSHLLYKHTELTLKQIGAHIDKDHSTIVTNKDEMDWMINNPMYLMPKIEHEAVRIIANSNIIKNKYYEKIGILGGAADSYKLHLIRKDIKSGGRTHLTRGFYDDIKTQRQFKRGVNDAKRDRDEVLDKQDRDREASRSNSKAVKV